MTKKYAIAGSLFVAFGMISFSLYVTRCRGESCSAPTNVNANANVAAVNVYDNQINKKMSPEQIEKEVANGEAVLVDVREESEWQAGHIAGAQLMPLPSLNAETTKNLPKDLPIYLYCRSGRRAGTAEALLQSLGFAKAKNIGGIIEWQENGGELVK